MRNLLARIAGRAVERPTPVIFAAVLLTLIGAVAALRLQADRSPDSLVDRGSSAYAETQRFYEEFGDEPVEILVKGDLRQVLATDNLVRLLALESCLSGKAPGGQETGGQPAPPACAADLPPRPERGRLRAGDLPEPVRDSGDQAASPSSRRRRSCGGRRRRSRPRARRRMPGFPPLSSSRPRSGAPEGVVPARATGPGPRYRLRPDGPAEAGRSGLRLRRSSATTGSTAACRSLGSRRSSPAPTRP